MLAFIAREVIDPKQCDYDICIGEVNDSCVSYEGFFYRFEPKLLNHPNGLKRLLSRRKLFCITQILSPSSRRRGFVTLWTSKLTKNHICYFKIGSEFIIIYQISSEANESVNQNTQF